MIRVASAITLFGLLSNVEWWRSLNKIYIIIIIIIDGPHKFDCSKGFLSIKRVLYETDKQVHSDINEAVQNIRNELQNKINLRPNLKSW